MRYILFILLLNWNTVTSHKKITFVDNAGCNSVFFKKNSNQYTNADYAKEAHYEYQRLKNVMDEVLDLDIVLHGYQNNKERNGLAEKRAIKVKEDLIKIGISGNRIRIIVESPLVITASMYAADKAYTRRVDFLSK